MSRRRVIHLRALHAGNPLNRSLCAVPLSAPSVFGQLATGTTDSAQVTCKNCLKLMSRRVEAVLRNVTHIAKPGAYSEPFCGALAPASGGYLVRFSEAADESLREQHPFDDWCPACVKAVDREMG